MNSHESTKGGSNLRFGIWSLDFVLSSCFVLCPSALRLAWVLELGTRNSPVPALAPAHWYLIPAQSRLRARHTSPGKESRRPLAGEFLYGLRGGLDVTARGAY